MTDTTSLVSVLTGDLVGSTIKTEKEIEAIFFALEGEAHAQRDWHGAPLLFSRHRGDGWQVMLKKPKYALRSALSFRAAIRAQSGTNDSYIGLATDNASMHQVINLNDATAPVFVKSGHALDYVKATPDTRFSYHGFGLNEALTTLIDLVSQGWTQTQAETVHPLIPPHADVSYTQIAAHLGKSRQAVAKAVEAAHWPRIDYALRTVEETFDD